jgi:hypothetical protein
MSSYKDLTNSPAYNFEGENKWDIKTPSNGWSLLDGSVLLQDSSPKLFEIFGSIQDNPAGYTTSFDSSTSGTTENINALIEVDNTFFYTGDGGVLASSVDYTNWTQQTSGTIDNINTLIYANNTFVYAGDGGVLGTSSDGNTWTTRTSGTANNINALTYGDGTFVYAGDGGVLATSPDGTTWTQRTSDTLKNINSLAYGNNTFVYVGDAGLYGTSTNAISWVAVEPELPSYVGGKTFARIGSTSTTSQSLTNLTGGSNAAPQEGDLVVIAVATGSTALRSQAVTGYTQIASLYSNDTEDTNLWVGYKIMSSTPDTTVTIPGSGNTDDAQTVAIQVWRNAQYEDVATAIGSNTVLANPPSITTNTGNTIVLVIGAGGHDVADEGAQTYAASYADNFLTIGSNDSVDSTIGFGSVSRPTAGAYDPAAFTFSTSDSLAFSFAAVTVVLSERLTTSKINRLTVGNGTFVYAGDGGAIATSPDGSTWTKRTSGTVKNINTLTYDNNTFAYGMNSYLATSPDGITWTQLSPTPQYVGGSTFTRLGATSSSSRTLAGLTGGTNSTPQAGDLVIIAVATGSGTERSQAVTGYTQIASLYSNDTEDTNLWVGYKIMGSTPDTTVGIPSPGSVDDAQTGVIQVWRNVEYVDATTTTGTNTVLANPPSITTNTADIVLVIGAGAYTGFSGTYAASYANNFLTSEISDTNSSTNGFGSVRVISEVYDPPAFTFNRSDSTAYSFAAVTITLQSTVTLNALINYKTTYYSAGSSGYLNILGFTTYDTINEFVLPTISTPTSIVNELSNDVYVKL